MGRIGFCALSLSAALALICAFLAPVSAQAAPPGNDNFADAALLSGDHIEVPGTTTEATFEPDEPPHGGSSGPSVWYSWTAPRSALIHLKCESSVETIVVVYLGSSLTALTEVGTDKQCPSSGAPSFSFRAAGGTEYRIAVAAPPGGGGGFSLMLDSELFEVPPNDDFANRGAMKDLGGNAFAFGTTAGAGRESGEPAHGGSSTGASVWYTWTAQRSGPTILYFCNGSFHPVIDVYAGTALGALTLLSAPSPGASSLDPMCSLGDAAGSVFSAVAGQTYAIAVDGANGDWGSFELRLREAPLPRVPRPPDTLIRKEIKIRGATAKVLFAATRGIEARYLCKLDGRPFRRCSSPKTYRGLNPGRHRFAVTSIALDEFGERDPTPAVRHFRIPKKRARR